MWMYGVHICESVISMHAYTGAWPFKCNKKKLGGDGRGAVQYAVLLANYIIIIPTWVSSDIYIYIYITKSQLWTEFCALLAGGWGYSVLTITCALWQQGSRKGAKLSLPLLPPSTSHVHTDACNYTKTASWYHQHVCFFQHYQHFFVINLNFQLKSWVQYIYILKRQKRIKEKLAISGLTVVPSAWVNENKQKKIANWFTLSVLELIIYMQQNPWFTLLIFTFSLYIMLWNDFGENSLCNFLRTCYNLCVEIIFLSVK